MKSALRVSSIIVLFMLAGSIVNAQRNELIQRGNFGIGSGIGYTNSVTNITIATGSSVHQGGNTAYQVHLTPSIGYFPANNWVVGLGMDYLVSSSQNNTPQSTTTELQRTSDTKLLFGPYSRIYFPFAGDQAFFLGAVYGYGKSDTQITSDGETQQVNTTLMTFGAGPGYTIFSSRHVALEAQAKYNYGISRNTLRVDGTNESTKTLTTAWDFVLGMHFYFNRQN